MQTRQVVHQLEPESHPLYQTGGKVGLTFPPGLAASHPKPEMVCSDWNTCQSKRL
jgi:hypothetical protein